MSQDNNRDCEGKFKRPSKSLVLTIFALAVILKLFIILVEILDFVHYLKGNEGQKADN